MAKTYGTVTTFTAGSVLTAAQLNVASTAVNNLVVPSMVLVRRTADATSYSSSAAVSWSSSSFDTDSMFAVGTPTYVTINTAGLYLVSAFLWGQAAATLTRVTGNILKNGSVYAQQESQGSTTNALSTVSALMNLVVGDQIGASMSFTGGSAYIIKGSATEDNTQSRLTLTWLGRTS